MQLLLLKSRKKRRKKSFILFFLFIYFQTFTGHASEVFRLIPLKNVEETQNCYFVSAAVGDRVINAW